MRVFVESIGGEIVSDYCFKGWLGAKNAGHDVAMRSLPAISVLPNRQSLTDVLPIGSVEYMKWFFEYVHGIAAPKPLNTYGVFTQRETFTVHRKKDLEYPVFVKPLDDHKLFTGFVAKSERDFDLYPELNQFDGPYWCSEPFEYEILSEWRVFIHKGKIKNVSCYRGNPTIFPTSHFIESVARKIDLLRPFKSFPIAFTWDVACFISDARLYCETIELNDAWAIGPYGCNEDDYFAMLKDRWNEIIYSKSS